MGNLAVSYFDEEYGGYGVGTRRFLSGAGADDDELAECNEAFQTLSELHEEHKLDLKLTLKNPCTRESRGSGVLREQVPFQVEL